MSLNMGRMLREPEGRIVATLAQELGVSSSFQDIAVLQHDELLTNRPASDKCMQPSVDNG